MPVKKIHVTNSAGRDATVAMGSLKSPPAVRTGIPGRAVTFRRYLATGEDGLHETLSAALGEDYGQALVDGDPEVDIETVGRALGKTDRVYLSSTGHVLYASPQTLEVILAPDGTERERRAPEDTPANVNDELPVRWRGRSFPKSKAIRMFAFKRTIQLKHVDGLSYDFLFGMAKELHDSNTMMLMGAGKNGRMPLVFQTNGSAYQALLEGRVDGEAYMLLLHLSNLQLKRPEA